NARAVERHVGGLERVAQADAAVAVDHDVALDDAVAAVVPEEDRPAGAASAAPDSDEDIVGNRPPGRVHHVDPADVVATERPRRVGWIVLVPLRAVVDKQAILDSAPPWPQTLAVRLRHLH